MEAFDFCLQHFCHRGACARDIARRFAPFLWRCASHACGGES